MKETWITQLADFGLSKYLSSQSMKAKSYKCSPFWSAPELWSPMYGIVDKYTNKVDIWSLGIILLQLWFGLDSKSGIISDNLLRPLLGKVENTPNLLDLLISYWPTISLEVFELLSHILVLEKERYDIVELMNHKTIREWSLIEF
jgi:serine/threonine protein kinase